MTQRSRRSIVLLSALLLAGCAGQKEAADTATVMSNILMAQSKGYDTYAARMGDYINGTRGLAADNINIGNRLQAETDQMASNLDVTGKGDAVDIYKKHSAVRPAQIAADSLLVGNQQAAWAPPSAPSTITAAVKALKPVAAGQSDEDQLSFFLGLTTQAKTIYDAQVKAAGTKTTP